MSRQYRELTPLQGKMLLRLLDGPVDDCVGIEAAEMTEEEIVIAEDLVFMGLVEMDAGWRGTVWYSLNLMGRMRCRSMVRPRQGLFRRRRDD